MEKDFPPVLRRRSTARTKEVEDHERELVVPLHARGSCKDEALDGTRRRGEQVAIGHQVRLLRPIVVVPPVEGTQEP